MDLFPVRFRDGCKDSNLFNSKSVFMDRTHYFESLYLQLSNYGICLVLSAYVVDFANYCAAYGLSVSGGALEVDAAGLTSQYICL